MIEEIIQVKNLVQLFVKVFVDGEEVTPDGKTITISIKGDVDSVQVDACDKIYINGNVNNISTMSGDVVLNEAKGDIKTTSGNVTCEGNCGGSITTVSGDVKAMDIAGSVKTVSGDIKKRYKTDGRAR